MKDIVTVMKFTIKDMVKRKSFIISTLIILLLIVIGFNVPNIVKSIKDSKAMKFYISNIMTEPGQTDNYPLSEHFRAIKEHIGTDVIEYCLTDTGEVVPEYIRKYNKEGSDLVEIDNRKLEDYNIKIIQRNMSTIKDGKI